MFYRIILYLSIFIFPTVTWADNNASSTVGVTGNVIKALTVLDATQGIEMPDLTLPDAGETTTVELLCVSSGASTVVFDDCLVHTHDKYKVELDSLLNLKFQSFKDAKKVKFVALLSIIASLTLTAGSDIVMPDIAPPDTAGDPVTGVQLICDNAGAGTVSYFGTGGNPFANGNPGATAVGNGTPADSANTAVGDATGICGSVTVAGQAGFSYTIGVTPGTLDSGAGVTLNGADCLSASNDSPSTGTLDGGGADTIYCGAEIEVAGGATVGAQGGMNFAVDVVYD
ncbi:hypothetical protein TI03_03135 [Achromatium sp. WMS1]|nr:hypothetical protein TI03_03135 [Achromatium sp. WMS1]